MTKDDKDIVLALRAALADRVGKDRFDLWFGRTVGLTASGNRLSVTALDQFSLDRIRNHFRRELESVFAELVGPPVQIAFHVRALPQRASRPQAAGPAKGSSPSNLDASPASRRTSSDAQAKRHSTSLQSFVVGDGNRLAYTSAQMVVQRPGEVSPLFLYGPTGCGKTHLLDGIRRAARRLPGVRRVVLVSAEQFTTLFLEALRGSGLPSFRRKYRDVQLLLIDDIQFFAGKRATLVELQHTVDTLLRQGRQLVLAADRSPAALSSLGPELTTRMAGGLVCCLERPDVPTRRAILERLAARRAEPIPGEVLDMIAARLAGDARQLSGALNRLWATRQALQLPVTLDMAERALRDLFQSTHPMIRLTDIESAVCDVFGLDPKILQSGGKAKGVSHPRMLAMWLARKYTRAAFSEIGIYFGRRSHSTVISAQKKVDGWLADGTPIRLPHGTCHVQDAVQRVEAQLRAG